MDTNSPDITTHISTEITRAGAGPVAGPRQLDISRRGQEPDAAPYKNAGIRSNKFAVWGSNNKYPHELVDLNMSDTTSSACLNFKIRAHYGKGLYLYKNEVNAQGQETKTPLALSQYPEIKEFFLINDIENIQQAIITDYEWWWWYLLEFIPGSNEEGKRKIVRVNRIPVVNTRLGLQDKDTGKIGKVYISGEFGGAKSPSKTAELAVKDKREIYADDFNPASKFGVLCKQVSVDRQYYPLPSWHSVNKFLNLSLEISDWILSNINNSLNIKYHVRYPNSYFENLHPVSNYSTPELRIEAMKTEKASLFGTLDDVLSGSQNAGKYFHSAVQSHPNKPELALGFEIIPMKNETNHDAYLPAFDTSAAAIANAHNAPLDLVGISLSKGMGAGSGSNIRESFNFYMQMHTEVPRQTTLEWLYLIKKINGWPDEVEFGYRNIIFQSVNENKSGYAVENEANPTSANK